MKDTKVSVIIPIYNTAAYLAQCLESVTGQTLRNTEIICVDDGSTDGSLRILEEYQNRDSRIILISQPNSGISAARNAGMRQACGEFVYFIDSDDYIEPDTLETTYRLATEEMLDVVVFGIEPFYASEGLHRSHSFDLVYKKEIFPGVHSGVAYLIGAKEKKIYTVNVCRTLWRRSFLCGQHLRFREGIIHEDNLFTFQALMAATRVLQIPNAFYHRRVRPGSIMTTPTSAKNVIGYFSCAEGVLEYLTGGPFAPDIEQEIRQEFTRMINAANHNYATISPEERKNVVFPREVENELFRQTVVVRHELMARKEELTHTRDELKRKHDELKDARDELGRSHDELKDVRDEQTRTQDELRRTYDELKCVQGEQARARDELARIRKSEAVLKRDLEALRHSFSFRLGRGLTWLPRMIRGSVRCLRRHGFRYTLRRAMEHLTGKAK